MSEENIISKTEAENPKDIEITFEIFVESIRSAISLARAKSIAQVFNLVKKGFSGELNREQVDQVFELLRDWKLVDMLALKLINEEVNGKLKDFAQQLARKIRFYFIQELKYPLPANSASVSSDEISDWIKNIYRSFPFKTAKNSTVTTETGESLPAAYSPDKYLRMAFVCLSNNFRDDFTIESIDLLLTEHLVKSGKKFRVSKFSFINLVNKSLNTKSLSSAIENILLSSAPFKEISVRIKESENELWRKYQSLQADFKQLETTENSLRNQLDETNRKNEEISTQLKDKTQALEEWKKENKDLDQHWREVAKEKLTKQANDINRKLKSEITEIKLSLEDQPPDVEVALLLLQRIEKILEIKN